MRWVVGWGIGDPTQVAKIREKDRWLVLFDILYGENNPVVAMRKWLAEFMPNQLLGTGFEA